MFVDCQTATLPAQAAAGLGWSPASPPTQGFSSLSWPAEPSLTDMIGDPVFRQLMASDRVSLENFTGLIATVRERLAQ